MAQNGVPIDSKPITGQATGMTFHPVKSASGAEIKAPNLLLPLHEGRGTSPLQPHRGQSSALVSGLLGTQSHFQHCLYRKMLSELEATRSFFVLFSKFKKGATGARPGLGTGESKGLARCPHPPVLGPIEEKWK